SVASDCSLSHVHHLSRVDRIAPFNDFSYFARDVGRIGEELFATRRRMREEKFFVTQLTAGRP
ncbi:MAG TPA: hypothetical protein VGG86_14835, partial [Roseiarcus sp.]